MFAASANADGSLCSKRRLPRLHWLSWLVLAMLTAALAVIAVPGMPTEAGPEFVLPSRDLPMPAPMTLVQAWEHGWPWPYLTRQLPYSWKGARFGRGRLGANQTFEYDVTLDRTVPVEALRLRGEPVVWTSRIAWQFDGDALRFSPLAAALDAAICLAIVAGAVALTERRLRRRGGLHRWSLADVLVVCTLIALTFGWHRRHQLRHDAQLEVSSLIERLSGKWCTPEWIVESYVWQLTYDQRNHAAPRMERPRWCFWDYAGPQWLARLVGNPRLLPFCWQLQNVDRRSNDAYMRYHLPNDLNSLEYTVRISASSDLSDIVIVTPDCLIEDLAPLAYVASLRRLKLDICATVGEVEQFMSRELAGRVSLDPESVYEQPDRVALRRLRRALSVQGPEPANADPRYLTLESLEVNDELMKQFAPFIVAQVRELTLGPTALTSEGWRLIGRSRVLESLDTGDAVLSRREVAEIRPVLMRELTLRQGDLAPDDFAILEDMPALVALTVFECRYTEAERGAIRSSLPDVQIEFIEPAPSAGSSREASP